MLTKLLLGVVMLFAVGCSYRPDITASKSVSFILKTPDLRIADVGFIRSNASYINVQVFTAGRLVLDLQLEETICLNGTCFDKPTFNRYFLKDEHYPDMMEALLRFEPIYEKRGLTKTTQGFTQQVHVADRQIHYEVNDEGMSYRDEEKRVLIKIRKIKGNG